MKRIHLHIGVDDLVGSIRFYTDLFGADPAVVKEDYAKWSLDDPSVNLAISNTCATRGVDHLGIETNDMGALAAITERLEAADRETITEEATHCCYAVSDKTWTEDPSGVRWETFTSLRAAERRRRNASCG